MVTKDSYQRNEFKQISLLKQNFLLFLPGMNALKGKRSRRSRTAFTTMQLEVLEKTFKTCQYPGIEMRDELAERTNLPEARIQVK